MLSNKYNAAESESKWQNYWQEIDIYKFNPESPNIFSIDTPPPTVSGHIHIGHIFSYSQVEMIARYWRMKGYEIFYPFGFDDNGLPTERFVEKLYKIKAHEMSREEFIEKCLATTAEFEESFKKLFISLGFSVDWDLEYSTINKKSQKISQKSFIDLYKEGKAYYSDSPALWCTECRTSIAQAEIETKLLESSFNYINFKISGTDENIVIATTRPELLPGCVSIFVNPDDKNNSKLIGKKAIVPLFNFEVPIMADEKVDMDKGTGIVMCCTFGDLTDLEWWRKYNLPLKKIVTRDGKIADNVPHYGGFTVHKARKQIVEDLKSQELLIKTVPIEHNVAVHERCSHAIEIIISKQWFIKILENKEKFLDAGNEINWYPHFMKDRYMNWVENLQWDWSISRQRYFGTPFPVWYCKECEEIVMPDDDQLPVNPLSSSPNKKCKCGCDQFVPERDIMDTWATSSVTPLINTNWSCDNYLEKIMPMSLRPNSHDIIRTWDFYTIVKNLYHLGVIPWNNVMISGFVLANKGEKISKSKGNNVHSPEQIIKQYSADAVRYWAASGKLGSDLVFSEEELRSGLKLITKLWNASKFALTHLEDYNDANNFNEILPLDKWILHKLSKTISDVCNYLDRYEVGLALNTIEKFFWNFCDNYIEIVKDRLYKPEIYGEKARLSGQKTIYITLFNLLKLFAIYFPHITEEIYQDYFKRHVGEESIHITKINGFKYDDTEDLIKKGDLTVEIISRVRRFKTESKLSLKTELDSITILANEASVDFLKTVEYDIKATCKCKDVKYIVLGESDDLDVNIEYNEI